MKIYPIKRTVEIFFIWLTLESRAGGKPNLSFNA
jgi:hypothetical protein